MNMLVVLAQQDNAGRGLMALFAGILMFIVCMFVIIFAIQALICYLVYTCFVAIPPEHRKQSPGLVWLLMIPIVPVVWNFFVYPKLAESYKSFFDANAQTDVGDCGRSLGLTFSILVACCIIPYINALTGLAALVVLVIFLIKAFELKRKVVALTGAQLPPSAPVGPA